MILHKLVYFIDFNKYWIKISKFQSICPTQLICQIWQILNFEKPVQLKYLAIKINLFLPFVHFEVFHHGIVHNPSIVNQYINRPQRILCVLHHFLNLWEIHVSNQWRILLCFEKFACQNELIGTFSGNALAAPPRGSTNGNYATPLQIDTRT